MLKSHFSGETMSGEVLLSGPGISNDEVLSLLTAAGMHFGSTD